MTLNSKFEETDSTLPTSLFVFTTNETTRQYSILYHLKYIFLHYKLLMMLIKAF